MFDIALSEMLVIAVVALIVIGPERLPRVARTLGHLWGRAQRYVNGVKADIARDMAVEEFRQLQRQIGQETGNVVQGVQQTSQALHQQIQEVSATVQQPPPGQNKFPVD